MIKNMFKIKYLLVLSLAINIFICLPLVSVVALDGTIQQAIYGHCAAHFGRHDIAFIGDSITLGGHVWASKIGVYNFNVWNYGAGGFTTDQIKFYAERVAKQHFKYCFVMSGRNDDDPTNLKPVNDLFKQYIKNITILRNAHVEPIVTLEIYKVNDPYYKYVTEFNNLVKSYCVANNITVIDINLYICNGDGLKREYSIDGTHINDKAYSIWGREINKVLLEKGYI